MSSIITLIIVVIGLPLLIEWVYDPCVAAEKRIVAIVLPTLSEKDQMAAAFWLPIAEVTADGRFFVDKVIREKEKEMHPAVLRGMCTIVYYRALFSADEFKSLGK